MDNSVDDSGNLGPVLSAVSVLHSAKDSNRSGIQISLCASYAYGVKNWQYPEHPLRSAKLCDKRPIAWTEHISYAWFELPFSERGLDQKCETGM